MTRDKGRASAKTIARHFPFVVETVVPEGGLGRDLDRMCEFHSRRRIRAQHGLGHRDEYHDFVRWHFAELAIAQAFTAEFSGTLLLPSNPKASHQLAR
jgi:hypothetical protein